MDEDRFMNQGNIQEPSKEDELDVLCDQVEQDSKFIMNNAAKKIIKPKAILNLQGRPFLYLNTINTIEGLQGTHKSRFAETLAGALLTRDMYNSTSFMTKTISDDIYVAYVETERNYREQAPKAIQHIKKCAGYNINEVITNLMFWPLISIDRQKRLALLEKQLNGFFEKNGSESKLVVILDLITDCITDFNSLADSFGIIDLMLRLNNRANATFIAVIHQNPVIRGSDPKKGRGHLGTELLNKSSMAVELRYQKSKYETPAYELILKKMRNSKLYDGCVLQYNEELELLEVIDQVVAEKNTPERRMQQLQTGFWQLFREKEEEPVPTADIEEFVGKLLSVSARTAKDLIKKFIKEGHFVLEEESENQYQLQSTKLKSRNAKGYLLSAV